MRPVAPLVPSRNAFVRLILGAGLAAGMAITTIQAQIPGRNVNMVSGTSIYDGDPFLQRQNEPSIAASTRNPLHLLGGSNDYRTVDLPFPADGDEETGDAWLGLFKSMDGGQRWTSSLLPGYPQDESDAGKASPLSKKFRGGYEAGADAVVRAGTNGLVYFSGLAFDRGEGGKSGIFLARFVDNNNQEAGDPFAYLGTVMVAKSTPGRFLDKPWMAVDIPRADSPTCTITADNQIAIDRRAQSKWDRDERDERGQRRGRRGRGPVQPPPSVQRIKAGAVYVAYTSFTGEGESLRSEIFMTRSVDCGATWSTPFRISSASDPLNQGASLTIDPRDGSVFVAWRRFANTANPDHDGIMVAKLPYGGKRADAPGQAHKFPHKGRKSGQSLHRIFEHGRVKARPTELADIAEFDQGSSTYSFRSNAYPTTASDGSGRIYLAWTQRGFPTADPAAPAEGARIMMVTTRDGRRFTDARAVDDHGQLGHQLMPSLAFGGGKLMLVYYDLRETRADRHGKYVTDAQNNFNNTGIRQTIDIRSAMAGPGDYPDFGNGSVKVSDYLMGVNSKTGVVVPLQVNPPNLPMFRQGTTPFIGDYIDVAVAPAFVPTTNGRWAYNTAASRVTPVFHAAWTDNRDVRPPFRDSNGDGNPWNDYTPANMSRNEPSRTSLSSPPGTTIPVPACVDGNAGSRNQNVYSARITGGLLAGSPGNAKPLGYVTDASGAQKLIQRGFVVFAQNATAETRRFRMSIRNQPVGGRASFEQFTAGQLPLTALEMNVPPRSTASRTVYATSTDPNASIPVDVTETTPPVNGVPMSLGLGSTILLNPDIENPDIENPDIENPDIENPDIENTELYNPDIENPDIENPDIENIRVANPDIENPDIENPDIENPDIENVRVANPDIENLTITNPDIENPDIENPDIENPDIENPDIENGAVADVTWKVSNTGNTTAAFNVNVFLAQQNLPTGVKTQLILFKTYRTPVTVANACQLGFQTRNVLVTSILNPTFIQPASAGPPDQNDPSEKNASMWLAPGEEGRITLRVIHDDLPQNLVTVTKPDGTTKLVHIDPAFAPTTSSTPTISSQGVNTDAPVGQTDPPLVTPTGANLFFLQMPSNGVAGAAIAPPVSVQVRDNFTGTPVAGAIVTLNLGNNPSEATLNGFESLPTGGNGIATFPNLTVSAVGSGFTLVATATTGGVAASATSTAFDMASPIPPGVVVNTNDSGPGSLRAAMVYANATPGVQTITFAIPGEGPAVISPVEALPPITESVIIDGFPQVAEHDGVPVVEVRGQAAWTGFDLEANAITIRGLAITQFGQGVFAFQGFTGHTLEQNYIGTNRANEDQGNNFGVVWRASNSAIRNNVISGNTADGLSLIIGASNNLVSGNRIGVSGDDVAALPNGNNGVTLYDAANNNTFEGNLISGNGGVGVDIQFGGLVPVAGTRFRNNTIGLDANGAAMANLGGGIRVDSAPDTVIGEPGAGNTISGNQVPPAMEGGDYGGGPGILVVGSTTVLNMPVIQANRLGTDAEGNLARPNKFEGVVLYGPARVGGSSLEGRGNRIAGNGVAAIGGGTGVAIVNAGAAGSIVQGNSIGVAAGGAALGNGYSGITVYGDVQSVLIGGDAAGEANIITGNETAGIAVYTVDGPSPQEITIAGNAIYNNGGLGIDLDANANSQQVAPVLSDARIVGMDTLVDFTMAPLEGDYDLRFFASPACDPGGSGEGATFLGTINANSGAFSLGALPVGYAITATATDSDGNTSEFSACAVVAIPPSATITAVLPGSPSADQMVTIQGNGLPLFFNPEFSRPRAFFTQGATIVEGFAFFGDSNKWWVRLPGGLAPGAATVYAANNAGVQVSAPFGLTISATPAAPIITAVLALNGATLSGGGAVCGDGYASLVPTGTATPGQGLGVVAYGVDTTGATVVFTQGASVFAVAADCAMSGIPPGLGVTVTVPLGLVAGPVSVTVKQAVFGSGTSPLSAPVILTVPAPPLPPMASYFVPGTAGGTANTNYVPVIDYPSAGGGAPISGGFVADGQMVQIAATGTVSWFGAGAAEPNGALGPQSDFLAYRPDDIIGIPGISLVARIGGGPWQFIGSGPTTVGGPGVSGELQLAVNDSYYGDNGDGFTATVTGVQHWAAEVGGNDAFYAFIPSTLDSVQGEASCSQAGGHLASILSASEDSFVGSLIDPGGVGNITAFIGGAFVDGWGWTDGKLWDYTNWRAFGNEPNGGGADTALQLWPNNTANAINLLEGGADTRGWNDVPTGAQLNGYVCKFAAPVQ